MTNRFSAEALFALRNHLPIAWVIEHALKLPVNRDGNVLSFPCPQCNTFETAINPETNLARCFNCRQNFNPIDIVMTARKLGFVQTVKVLQRYAPKPALVSHDEPTPRSPSTPNRSDTYRRVESCPQSVKQILKGICQ
jgi:hypothetical protein